MKKVILSLLVILTMFSFTEAQRGRGSFRCNYAPSRCYRQPSWYYNRPYYNYPAYNYPMAFVVSPNPYIWINGYWVFSNYGYRTMWVEGYWKRR